MDSPQSQSCVLNTDGIFSNAALLVWSSIFGLCFHSIYCPLDRYSGSMGFLIVSMLMIARFISRLSLVMIVYNLP